VSFRAAVGDRCDAPMVVTPYDARTRDDGSYEIRTLGPPGKAGPLAVRFVREGFEPQSRRANKDGDRVPRGETRRSRTSAKAEALLSSQSAATTLRVREAEPQC
jgi:hypothetical protein